MFSGKYRLEPAGADFFGTNTVRFIERGSAVIGRFGRSGVIRGSIDGRLVEAQWSDRQRHGWMRLHCSTDYKSCDCEYGTQDGPECGRATLSRVARPGRRGPSLPGGAA